MPAPYRILHLSDIHFGASFDRSLWDYVVALARRERPNLIACTGDLVDHGGLFMLAAARRQLDELTAAAGPGCVLRCVPGNHDCGPWGNLNFRPFATNFAAVFGPKAMALPARMPDWLRYRAKAAGSRALLRGGLTPWLYLAKWRTALQRWRHGESLAALPLMRGPDDPAEVALIYLDSNHTQRLASGSVDVREITRLKSLMLGLRDEGGARPFVPRIALIHHHPLPIPDASITEGLTSFEPFLVLRNAGILLKELNRCDVDLILHGHKHYASFARLGYSVDHRVEGEIAVLAAGSAGVTLGEQGRNSVNFIDVFETGRMTYTALYFGGGGGEPVTELFRNTRHVHGMAMHKMRVHRRATERQGQWIEAVDHQVNVENEGSATVLHDVRGHVFERNQQALHIPVSIAVSMGRISHATLELSEASRRAGHTWEDAPKVPRRVIHCGIDVGQRLATASPPVSYGYKYVSFNTYSITEWETLKVYERDQRLNLSRGHAPGLEFTGVVVRVPVRMLTLQVRLPAAGESPEPAARVMRWSTYPDLQLDAAGHFVDEPTAGQWVLDPDLTAHEAGHLVRIAEHLWELRVEYPLVGHRYEVKWRVRDTPSSPTRRREEVARRGLAVTYRDILLNLQQRPAHLAAAKSWADSLREHLLLPNFGAVIPVEDDLEVALFAYDDALQELRQVLCSPQADNGLPHQPLTVPLGEGVVGAALKRGNAVVYIDPRLSGSRDDAAYLFDSAPEEQWTEPKWKFVVAFPIFAIQDAAGSIFGDEILQASRSPDVTVGVMTIASAVSDSGLLRLTEALVDGPEEEEGGDDEEPVAVGEEPTLHGIWAFAHILLLLMQDPPVLD